MVCFLRLSLRKQGGRVPDGKAEPYRTVRRQSRFEGTGRFVITPRRNTINHRWLQDVRPGTNIN